MAWATYFLLTVMYKPWAPAFQVLRRAQIALKSVEEEEGETDLKDEKPKGRAKGKAKAKAKNKPGRPKGKAKGKAKAAAKKASTKTETPKAPEGDGSDVEMKDGKEEGEEEGTTGCEEGEKSPTDVGPHGFDCEEEKETPKPKDSHEETPKGMDEETAKPVEEKPEKPKRKRTEKKHVETGASNEEPAGKKVREKKVKKDEGETGPSPKIPKKEAATFARRPEPTTQLNKMKWHALRGAFSKVIKPDVTAPSKHEAPGLRIG